MRRTHVFTSAACNYIPKVRALAESVRRWHPEWVFHLALSDQVPAGLEIAEPCFDEIHPAETLGIPDFSGWAFCHSIVELSTAIKPFMLLQLLQREDCAGVVYLDPDTVVFSRLDEVTDALRAANVALTPHQVAPESGLEAVMDNEIGSLKHGIYNLGFLAVAKTEVGRAFAQWWADRSYYFCRADIPNGLFTDQRWIDLAPALFDGIAILRSPRLNVAPWNLTTRWLSGEVPSGVMVGDEALGFYHFTGFDSGAHRVMACKNGAGNTTVTALVNWYSDLLCRANQDPLSQIPWAYGFFSNGSPVTAAMRWVYRERLDLQHVFREPFDVKDGGLAEWWEMHGRQEYPKLFDETCRDSELIRLKSVLTPGFRAGAGYEPVIVAAAAEPQPEPLPTDVPAQRLNLPRRAWKVFRAEGYRGVARRLWSF